MIKIFTDTSTMYTPQEGAEKGFKVFPLSVSINNQTYQEFVDIDTPTFYEQVLKGSTPSSSQPPIGMLMEAYDECQNDEIIHICMADGLSGTYQSALSAKDSAVSKENIHVINSKTLCAPQRFMVDKVMELVAEGKNTNEILLEIQRMADSAFSFLIPQDFSFLKRGGRLTPLAATIGGVLKLKPVMMQTEDGCRLEKFTLARTMGKAVDMILEDMRRRGIDSSYSIGVSHAYAKEQAEDIAAKIKNDFPDIRIELFELTPAFITQGGPQCIAIQAIQC